MLPLLLIALLALTGPSAGQDRSRPQIDLVDLTLRIHELINAERAVFKLPPLKIDEKLSGIARSHSEDMARRRFFDHVNPDGHDATARGRAAKYTCQQYIGDYFVSGLAENIFQNNLYSRVIIKGEEMTFLWNTAEKIALSTVDGWMGSPGHRRTILTSRYARTGVGIAIASNDKVFITQLFC
jgi:uncharacterized protein YkwD